MKKMTLSSLAMTVLCMALNAQITIQLPANFTPHKVPDEIKGVNISANSNFGWINNTSFIDEIQRLDLGIFRYPGGTSSNNYDWKKELGNSNKFNFRRAAQFSQLYDIDINYSVNYGTTTAAEAAELVRLCNSTDSYYDSLRFSLLGVTAPLNIKVWELGNELGAAWEWHVSWVAGGANQEIHLGNGLTKQMPRTVTDSLHFFWWLYWKTGLEKQLLSFLFQFSR